MTSAMRAQLAKLLREPLVHFLVLGAVLLAVFGVRDGRPPGDRQRIAVDAEQIARMSDMFARTWHRPPSDQEARGLIDDFLREEIFYREALAMGLDRDDTVIRRRLRQKLEFVGEDLAAQAQPSDEELADLLTRRADTFRTPPSISFEQVFVSGARRGADAPREAERVLASLNSGGEADLTVIGDSSLLDDSLRASHTVRRRGRLRRGVRPFGVRASAPRNGAGRSARAMACTWCASACARRGALRPLDDVRALLVREHQAEKRRASIDSLYQALRDRYEIVVERPPASAR